MATRTCRMDTARKVLAFRQAQPRFSYRGRSGNIRSQRSSLDLELAGHGIAAQDLVDRDDFSGHFCMLMRLERDADAPAAESIFQDKKLAKSNGEN